MKQKYEFKNVVAETLLIPLYMRAKESRRKGDAILKDTMAEQLVDSIEYDYSQFDGAKMSEVGCVVRGKYFDVSSQTTPTLSWSMSGVVWIHATNVSATTKQPSSTNWTCRKSSTYAEN